MNDPLLFTPSEASVNVHYVSNNASNNVANNNNNIKNTNAPQQVRSNVSVLKSTSDALHSAQSALASNPLTSTSLMKRGLLYASLLPKSRTSTSRTNLDPVHVTQK